MASLGTFGHKIAENVISREPTQLTEDDQELLAKLNLDELAWFRKSIKTCVDHIVRELCRLRDEWGPENVQGPYLETKIASTWIDDHGGTCDVIIVTPETLHGYDYKFGSEAVIAEGNEQIMCYLNLARQLHPGRKRFFGTIIQPAYKGVDEYEFTADELDAFLTEAVESTKSKDRRGGEWCEWCTLLPTCKEAGRMVVQAADEFGSLMDFINEADGPTRENVEKLERIIMMHRLATNAFKAASKLLKDWHNRGGVDLKYHRIAPRNNRSWNGLAMDALMDQLPEDKLGDAIQVAPITPAKLQELLGMKKQEFNDLFKPYINFANSPQLRAGAKPSIDELVNDLPIFEEDN